MRNFFTLLLLLAAKKWRVRERKRRDLNCSVLPINFLTIKEKVTFMLPEKKISKKKKKNIIRVKLCQKKKNVIASR